MNNSEMQTQILNLKSEIEDIKKDKKDWLDIVQILGSILLPVAIAFVGWRYTTSIENAKIKSDNTIQQLEIQLNEQQREFDKKITQANAKINQANLVSSFLEPLVSKHKVKQKLAIEAVIIALPEHGAKLVKIIQDNDTSTEVTKFATKSLKTHKKQLVKDFFSDEEEKRKSAYSMLASNYKNDPEVIAKIIANSKTNTFNQGAISNVVLYLDYADTQQVKKFSKEIIELSDKIPEDNKIAKVRAQKLLTKLK